MTLAGVLDVCRETSIFKTTYYKATGDVLDRGVLESFASITIRYPAVHTSD
jgi:hypothetical protein